MPKTFADKSIEALCLTSDFEQAINRYYHLLCEVMPIDGIFINTFLDELQTVKFIYTTGRDPQNLCGTSIDVPIILASKMSDPKRPSLRLVNHLEQEEVSQYVIPRSLPKIKSMMYFILNFEGEYLGILSLYSYHAERFKEHHPQLIINIIPVIGNLLKRHLQITGLTYENQQLKLQRLKFKITDQLSRKIIGYYTGLQQIMRKIEYVADQRKPVLLQGEVGVGKRLIAQAIHQLRGGIADKLFYLDCKVTTTDFHWLADAINDPSASVVLDNCQYLQQPLLKLLFGGVPQRLLIKQPKSRLILLTTDNDRSSATYYFQQLQQQWLPYQIEIPPLRDRKQDLQRLIEHFLQQHQANNEQQLDVATIQAQLPRSDSYSWPGNITELNQKLGQILVDQQCQTDGVHEPDQLEQSTAHPEALLPFDELVAQHLKAALNQANGVIHGPNGAAQLIGMNPNTFRSKMRKYQLL
ncbi:sigma 54-interacting transcriptional regulator [Ferrimonas senticii]|uniref:sigma 54-interacting transcriptional regulator n=1 Tax=Ferrimonas senticii TaxID=394566 RepID=UPI00040693A8|nr:sigma 54-interacting transcriptional regulator [Ferrimonas senticii]